jgi:hypothetical protein
VVSEVATLHPNRIIQDETRFSSSYLGSLQFLRKCMVRTIYP